MRFAHDPLVWAMTQEAGTLPTPRRPRQCSGRRGVGVKTQCGVQVCEVATPRTAAHASVSPPPPAGLRVSVGSKAEFGVHRVVAPRSGAGAARPASFEEVLCQTRRVARGPWTRVQPTQGQVAARPGHAGVGVPVHKIKVLSGVPSWPL